MVCIWLLMLRSFKFGNYPGLSWGTSWGQIVAWLYFIFVRRKLLCVKNHLQSTISIYFMHSCRENCAYTIIFRRLPSTTPPPHPHSPKTKWFLLTFFFIVLWMVFWLWYDKQKVTQNLILDGYSVSPFFLCFEDLHHIPEYSYKYLGFCDVYYAFMQ